MLTVSSRIVTYRKAPRNVCGNAALGVVFICAALRDEARCVTSESTRMELAATYLPALATQRAAQRSAALGKRHFRLSSSASSSSLAAAAALGSMISTI